MAPKRRTRLGASRTSTSQHRTDAEDEDRSHSNQQLEEESPRKVSEGTPDMAQFQEICAAFKAQSSAVIELQNDMQKKLDAFMSKHGLGGVEDFVTSNLNAHKEVDIHKEGHSHMEGTINPFDNQDTDPLIQGPVPTTGTEKRTSLTGATGTEVLRKCLQDAEKPPKERLDLDGCDENMRYLQRMEIILDANMSFIILTNAFFIGFQMDLDKPGGPNEVAFSIISNTYTLIFTLEIGLNLVLKGCKQHFTGSQKNWAWFELFLVSLDYVLLVFRYVSADLYASMPSWFTAVIRLLRLMKIMRVLKILKSDIFSDLMKMIQGWALILFLLFMYVFALTFRTLYGEWEDPSEQYKEHVLPYFSTVPRSLLTTFRCAFGDCSTYTGMPIFEWIAKETNHDVLPGIPVNFAEMNWPSTFYVLFLFVISIGVFNVIAAIFVESTMDAANAVRLRKVRERMSSKIVWSSNVYTMIRLIYRYSNLGKKEPELMSEVFEELIGMEVPVSVIDEVMRDDEALQALEALDINSEDKAYLGDILDPDNGGTVTMFDVVDGLRRLRGEPRRSDIISCDLMIRSMQSDLEKIWHKVRKIK